MSNLAISVRLSSFFVVSFAFWGVQMPYWPLWLKDIGLSSSQIGLLLACTYLVKASNPITGYLVDKYNNWRAILLGLSISSTAAYSLYFAADGFWALLMVTLLSGALLSAIQTTAEGLAVSTAISRKMNYGRIRLWGSVSFIMISTMTGHLLEGNPLSIVLWLCLGCLVCTILACFFILPPSSPRTFSATKTGTAVQPPSLWLLLRHPVFVLLLGTVSLIQVSHVVYYGFSSLYWQKSGLSDFHIGLLWAEGVIGEILLFAFSGYILKKITPLQLILLGAIGSLIRWTVLGATTDFWLLSLVQWMHGITFAMTHLGTLFFIAHIVPNTLSGRAQALYFALPLGLFQGSAMIVSGSIFDTWGGNSFYIMTLIALGGLGTGLGLKHYWNGQKIRLG